MPPIIDIIRHAEGRNNTESNQLRDPELTMQGIEQCKTLHDSYPHGDKVKWIYASPLRRTIMTAQLAIRPLVGPGRIILLPELQENSARPSDTGRPKSELEREFGTDVIDTELLSGGEDWFKKTPDTSAFPSLARIEERARFARTWLRAVASKMADDERIVVVTHGAFAHFLVEDFAGLRPGRGSGVWRNTGLRSYRFSDLHGTDDYAHLEEVNPQPGADWSALSDEEKARQKSYAVDRLRRHEEAARAIFNLP